jgi:hypothetical protein
MQRGVVSLILSTCLIVTAPAVVASAPSAPPDAKPSEAATPPITFYVAKGAPGACGPGCQEWIAAEGKFDAESEPRLWELLRKLGDRKLPVYFNSGGGQVLAGFEVGRLLRKRGLTVGVGLTIPTGCDRKHLGDEKCERLKRSGEELAAELDGEHTFCASSCVWAFLGGVRREVAAGGRLGIHDMFMPSTFLSADENGHIGQVPLRQSEADARKSLQSGHAAIAGYLRQMGINPDLLAASRAVPSDQLYFLTRADLFGFGIDRREAAESAWVMTDTPAGMSAVKIIEARDAEAGVFRRSFVSLVCRDKTSVRLQYVRKGDAEAAPRGFRLGVGGRSVPLTRLAAIAQGDRPPAERHYAELPLSALDETSFVIESDDSSGESPDSPARSPVRITVQAAAPVLGALARRCSSGV